MGAMFKQFFLMFQFTFAAGSKVAESLDVLATSGLEMSNQHLESARHERTVERLKLDAKVAQLEAEIAAQGPKKLKSA